VSKAAFDAKIAALEALRQQPADVAEPALRKGLRVRNNFIVAKVASIVGDSGGVALIPDLLTTFDRMLDDAVTVDSQCWAKNAVAKALKDLSHTDPEVYLRGLAHVQMEPVWGGQVDTAITLRGTCVLALVDSRLDDRAMLNALAGALADPEKGVRIDAAVALSRAGIPEAVALLRLKVLLGDAEAEVTGQCLFSLLQLSPGDSVDFAARFLSHKHPDDMRAEAANALAQVHEASALVPLTAMWRTTLSPDLRSALLGILAASPQRALAEFLRDLNTPESRAALATSRHRDVLDAKPVP
jgi:HEAT repeat protein